MDLISCVASRKTERSTTAVLSGRRYWRQFSVPEIVPRLLQGVETVGLTFEDLVGTGGLRRGRDGSLVLINGKLELSQEFDEKDADRFLQLRAAVAGGGCGCELRFDARLGLRLEVRRDGTLQRMPCNN